MKAGQMALDYFASGRLAIHFFPVYHVMSTLCLEINIAGAQADKLSWFGAHPSEESIMSEHLVLFSDL